MWLVVRLEYLHPILKIGIHVWIPLDSIRFPPKKGERTKTTYSDEGIESSFGYF